MQLKRVLKKIIYAEGMTELPLGIIFTLFSFFLFEGMAITTLFSYLPKLVKSFGSTEVGTGVNAGLITSTLYVARIFSSFLWGYVGDKFGKKKSLIIAGMGLAVSTFAFGFSTSMTWAITTRFLQGLFMGLNVITKSILTEICDDSNLSLGFALVLSGYKIGMIFGPSMSGYLSFLGDNYPNTFSKDGFLSTYGGFAPNTIVTIGLIGTNILTMYMLPSDGKKNQAHDIVLIPKECNETISGNNSYLNLSIEIPEGDTERTPLLESHQSCIVRVKNVFSHSRVFHLLRNKDYLRTIIFYGVFSVLAMGHNEIFSVFAATSVEYNGLNYTTANIGTLLLIVAGILTVTQLTLFPKVLHRFGSKMTVTTAMFIYAIVAPLNPISVAVSNKKAKFALLCLVQLVMRIASSVGFITADIFLNNSVEGRQLGVANGLGLSISSIGRAIGPTFFGAIYTWSIKNANNPKEGHAFPLNYYLVFLVISMLSFIIAILLISFPSRMDTKSVAEKKPQLKILTSQFTHNGS